jgi:ubiquinone/menaquinone biosynthesis C-methylase UbiE
MSTSDYILGSDDAELARLGAQHQLWAAATAAAWERAGFGAGQRLLDVGAGPGYAAFDLARLVGPAGQVLAVDRSERFLRHLDAQARARGVTNVETRVADVTAFELPEASFDGAFARWVLCFVPDPQALVDGVAQALRPGSRFVVMDYCRYEALTLAPRSAVFERVVRAVADSFRAAGGDPDVGTALPTMMINAGLEVREVRPVVRVARAGSPLWEWPIAFFRGFLPTLVVQGAISQADAESFLRDWDERSTDPAAFLLSPPMVEVIGVRR